MISTLIEKCMQGDLQQVKSIVKASANFNIVSVKDSNGITALMEASKQGHLEIVKYLVEEAGADVNAKDKNGSTALMCASKHSHLEIVEY